MSILDQIIATKIEEVEQSSNEVTLAELKTQALKQAPTRNFAKVIRNSKAPAIIAEIKRASPSRGIIRKDLDPIETAICYASNGAQAISVLTDAKYFMGSLDFLRQIRAASIDIPLLRKDFIISTYQIWEARLAGADAILLIAAALDDDLLLSLAIEASIATLDVLLEVHNAAELERALRCFLKLQKDVQLVSLPLLGINNRNLHSFATDIAVTEELSSKLQNILSQELFYSLKDKITIVTESGISKPEDITRLLNSGAHAFLVGESLVASGDPGQNLKELIQGSTT